MTNTARSVASMFVLGLAALAVVGVLMQWRTGRAVAERAAAVGTTGAAAARPMAGRRAAALAGLAEGAALSMDHAAQALRVGERQAAVHALDAALRATEIGTHAVPESPFRDAHEAVRAARRALQNGRMPPVAPLNEAASRLRRFTPPASTASGTVHPRYEGATAVNARGVRVGELREFRRTAAGGQAVIQIGGWQDFMGFLDFGGEELIVASDGLVLGPAGTFRPTMVAVVEP